MKNDNTTPSKEKNGLMERTSQIISKSFGWGLNFFGNVENYKICLLVFVIITSIPMFTGLTTFLKAFHIWTVYIIGYDYFHDRMILNKKNKLLFFFIGSYAITILLNVQWISINNLSEAIYFIAGLLILASSQKQSRNQLIGNIRKIASSFIILVTPLNFLSIFYYLQDRTVTIWVNGIPKYVGMYEHDQRLMGYFGNPVDLAFYSIIGLFFSLLLLKIYEKSKLRYLFKFSLFVNITTLIMSNTRTHFFTVLIIIFLALAIANKHKLPNVTQYIKKALPMILLLGVSLLTIALFTDVFSNIRYFDFSLNGRLGLWSNALSVILRSPLFGVGFGNFKEVALALGLNISIGLGGSIHQGLLDLLVSTGLTGTIFLVAHFYRILKKGLKYLYLKYETTPYISLLWFMCIALLITSVADSTIVFPMYITNVVFLIAIGYLSSCIESEKKNGKS